MRWLADCTRLVIFFPIVLLGLELHAPGSAAAADFELTVVNTQQTISCEKLRLDPGCFRCKRGDVTYKYKAAAIDTVTILIPE